MYYGESQRKREPEEVKQREKKNRKNKNTIKKRENKEK